MTTAPPLAYIYDRCATANPAMLNMRLQACEEHVAERGWVEGGRFIDYGDDALTTDRRPAFERLLDVVEAERGRELVCLVYDWGRLSHDVELRRNFTHRLLLAGAWLANTDGDSVHAALDERLMSALRTIV